MLQICRRPNLGEETGSTDDSSQIRVKHLHRDMPVVLQVARQVDCGHSTLPQLALDRVTVGEGARQTLEVDGVRVHAGCAQSNRPTL